ncbi:site-2 protease family protein [Roseofilum reptotaenium CS-1145]|nr:site-2 protease family protein [Roseofilum reptotaenium]MDB9517693.1 site-2 protease family protein [Roseofilum reptotaenium CS-1145]
MNGNIRVGSLFGIPFYLHLSWFLLVGLVTFSYGIIGLGVVLLVFSSVVAHELGHGLVAIRQRIGIKSITLFLFGGLARLEKEPQTPSAAFWVAIAGPGINLILFGLFMVIGRFTFITMTPPLSIRLASICGFLAYINLILGLVNLIPGLPLDGGHILKALVWKITGKPKQGLMFASRMGQIMGCLGVAICILSWFNIPVVLFGIRISGGIWTFIISWFMVQNAGAVQKLVDIQTKIYSQYHEFVRVDAQDFSHLDLKFYQQAQRQLERLGFEKLADIEDVTISGVNRSQPRFFFRLMLSRDRRTVAWIHTSPLSKLVKGFQAIGLAPQGGKMVSLDSEFEGGTFLLTLNTQGFSNLPFPTPNIEDRQFPTDTSISELVRQHRIRVRDLNPHTPALIVRNFDQAIALEHRLETLMNQHKQAQGYVTRNTIERNAQSS